MVKKKKKNENIYTNQNAGWINLFTVRKKKCVVCFWYCLFGNQRRALHFVGRSLIAGKIFLPASESIRGLLNTLQMLIPGVHMHTKEGKSIGNTAAFSSLHTYTQTHIYWAMMNTGHSVCITKTLGLLEWHGSRPFKYFWTVCYFFTFYYKQQPLILSLN